MRHKSKEQAMFKFPVGILAIAWFASSHLAADPTPPHLLVPAYFYPVGEGMKSWETLLDSASKAPIVAIVNPASGPGKKVDPNYTTVFTKGKESKATLIGYITLSYAKRPLAEVLAEVDRWIEFYPQIRGIFFDEQPSDAKNLPFSLQAFAHARKKIDKALVISNPGTNCDAGYVGEKAATATCLFEGPGGFGKYKAPDWVAKAGSGKTALLTYGVEAIDMKVAMQLAMKAKVGYVFVTDAKGANPWDRLPTYWDETVALVGGNLKAK